MEGKPSQGIDHRREGHRERASIHIGEREHAMGGGGANAETARETSATEIAERLASLNERLNMVKSEITKAEALPPGMNEKLLEGLRKRETDLTQTIADLERPTIN